MSTWRLSISQDEQKDVGDGVGFIGPSRREKKEHLLPTAGSEISSREDSDRGSKHPGHSLGPESQSESHQANMQETAFLALPAHQRRTAGQLLAELGGRPASLIALIICYPGGFGKWQEKQDRKEIEQGMLSLGAQSLSAEREACRGRGAGERRKKVGDMQRKGGGQPEEENLFLKWSHRLSSLKSCGLEYPAYIELDVLLLIVEPLMIQTIFRNILVLKQSNIRG